MPSYIEAVEELQRRQIVIETAAKRLIELWDQALPHIDSAIVISTVHSCPYAGPNVGEAVEALRTAIGLPSPVLRPTYQPPSDQTG